MVKKTVKPTKQDEEPAPVKPEKLYSVESWKGVKEVYKCAKCGTFRDDKSALFEHILLHFPVIEQEEILNQLVQELTHGIQ